MSDTTERNDLALPLYASKPQRRVPGTNVVAVTMEKSSDGSVAVYTLITADGKAMIGTAHFHPKRRVRSRHYCTHAVCRFHEATHESFANLTEFATEMGRRLDVSVVADA